MIAQLSHPLAQAFYVLQQGADGGQPATIKADDLIAGWRANLGPKKTSLHLRGNHVVDISGDNATIRSHAYAWNRMEGNGDPLWEAWGNYVYELKRGAGGWKVTHFNRGKRDADGVPGVETLHGDRKGQLDALRGRQWDAVVDNTGYIPKYVKQSAELLAPNAGYCLFISSISAYAGFAAPNDETSPTGKLANIDEEKVTGETYGPMKALCESYTMQAFADRASVVRPGYIVGPLDPTDRFTYWPVRASRGGEMLAPGTPQDPVQVIDARDLTA